MSVYVEVNVGIREVVGMNLKHGPPINNKEDLNPRTKNSKGVKAQEGVVKKNVS